MLDSWRSAIGWVEAGGGEVVEVSLPRTREALAAYYTIALAEASSNLAKYDGIHYGARATGGATAHDTVAGLIRASRSEAFGPEVTRRIVAGNYVLSRAAYQSYYAQAQRVRRLVVEEFASAFGRGRRATCGADAGGAVHALLTPTAPTVAPTVSEAMRLTPLAAYANDVFTVPASLAGLPAISVPAGGRGGEPIGLQVIGPHGGEGVVLQVAQGLEDAAAAANG